MLLGTSALTLVTFSSAAAAPIIESGDFGDTFATRTILSGQGPVSGGLGGTDMFDYFQLSGFGANQSIRIVLTQISQLPEPSASASASGSEEPTASGSEEPSASGSEEPTASGSEEPTASGSEEPTASGSEEPTASGSEEPSTSTEASGSEEPTASGSSEPSASASASGSEEPTDVGFTLHLLDETGAFDPLAGDSGPDTGASGNQFPADQVFGDRSFTFDLDTSALPTGDLNLRLAFDGSGDAFYQVTVTARSTSTVSAPSGVIPLTAGAAGLGFLAARRRRKK